MILKLEKYVNQAEDRLNNNQTVEEQLAIIAEIVSDALGGLITKSEIVEFGYEMAIVELKRSENSNVIPLGKIKKGLYRERALLFKVICDQVGLPVTLGKTQKLDHHFLGVDSNKGLSHEFPSKRSFYE